MLKHSYSNTQPPPGCPFQLPGWARINNKDYYLSKRSANQSPLTWFEAEAKAIEVGGLLAKISSAEETDAMSKVLKKCT